MNSRILPLLFIFGFLMALPLYGQWTAQNSNVSSRIWAIQAVDENCVWAATENGTALRTTDGGETWTPLSIPGADVFIFYSIEAINADTAYFVGVDVESATPSGSVYKTTDGGQSWELKFENDDIVINSIAFWDDANGMITANLLNGDYPLVYTTSDGGDSWTETAEENMPPLFPGEFPGFTDGGGNSLEVKGDSLAWFGTAYNIISDDPVRVFRSTDKGQSWMAVNTDLTTDGEFHGIGSIVFHDALNGYAGGVGTTNTTQNTLVKTTDGGLTWEDVPTFQWDPLGMSEIPGGDSLGIAANSFGGTFFSTDGGSEWESLGDGILIGLTFASPTAGWACFLNGVILKYDGPGLITSVAAPEKEERAFVRIEAVHPNPFAGTTNIQFSIAQPSAVQLEIVNTAGQVVARPINEELAPGRHQVSWAADDLPSGVYICRLRAGAHISLEKIVIVE